MRTILVAFSAVLCLSLATAAHAERRLFVIANDADGYGIDRCLADGAKCGTPVANAYCKQREFAHAASFSKVDRDDVTGAIPTGESGACKAGKCQDLVAIVCTR
jgi:hypothetical protein